MGDGASGRLGVVTWSMGGNGKVEEGRVVSISCTDYSSNVVK